ncbi:MAG: UDP-glucose 4-epimerase GalE [Synergistaceae bacterium]|jgi:UDP-glucose 4-epimerase|nr:UDP-glucose 4-epimerase GalE [Synergistaceae bacterium]
MSVLVTGGAGYIGSHTCVELLGAGYDVVVADNFANSKEEVLRRVEKIARKSVRFRKMDVCDPKSCEKLFAENPDIDAVIHFAALKAVGESVALPLEYYYNNLTGALTILGAMKKHGVARFVFSSSATVYGSPETVPVREDFPTSTTNPYGTTKLFIERMLHDICAVTPGFNAAVLRYFNPIGAHRSGLIGEDPNGIPNNLVPYIAQVAAGKHEYVRVFGNDYPTPDGTGVRDYIHVVDLARGHVSAIKKLAANCGEFICNLGAGRGYSVLEVIDSYGRACGKRVPYRFEQRRPGDVAVVYADPSKARVELGWTTEFGIDDMCADSWRWQSRNPDGYSELRRENSRVE